MGSWMYCCAQTMSRRMGRHGGMCRVPYCRGCRWCQAGCGASWSCGETGRPSVSLGSTCQVVGAICHLGIVHLASFRDDDRRRHSDQMLLADDPVTEASVGNVETGGIEVESLVTGRWNGYSTRRCV